MTSEPADRQVEERRAELSRGLAAVRRRIERACAAAGRAPEEIRLVVVTKTRPASDVVLLRRLGVEDVGENRDQEAAAKYAEVARELGEDAPRWHFVGQLQSNKARHVARYADVVQSVDRPSLVAPLQRGAAAAGRRIECLIQVSLDGDPRRGGVVAPGVPALAEAIQAQPNLLLRGVMAVAPLGADPAAAFEQLLRVSERLRRDHPDATVVSAGMSADLEEAVAAGATHLRVGTAILGPRPGLG
jgi:pyridoxal phosphate enzyme (YggS family)